MAEEWYYSNNGQQMGPVSEADLRALANDGGLKPTDLVWTDGMSAWTPASATRGFFASAAAVPAAAQVAPQPKTRPRYDDRWEDEDDYRPHRRRRAEAGGWSTAVIIALVLGAVLVVSVGGFMVLVMMAAVEEAARPQQQVFGNQPGRPVPPPNLNPVPQANTYQIDFKRPEEENIKVIQLAKGQTVTVTVTTTNWGNVIDGRGPDIDLYIYGPGGDLITFDDGEFKDCIVTFAAPEAGAYQILVVNLNCQTARCTVKY